MGVSFINGYRRGRSRFTRMPKATVSDLRSLLEETSLLLIEANNPGVSISEVRKERLESGSSWLCREPILRNDAKPWQAKGRIREMRLDVYIGNFSTKEEAQSAVDAWYQRKYGGKLQ